MFVRQYQVSPVGVSIVCFDPFAFTSFLTDSKHAMKENTRQELSIEATQTSQGKQE